MSETEGFGQAPEHILHVKRHVPNSAHTSVGPLFPYQIPRRHPAFDMEVGGRFTEFKNQNIRECRTV